MTALPEQTGLQVPVFTPAHLVTIDFETFYSKEYSLTKYTMAEYVRDPRFEVLGVAVKVDDQDTLWFEHEEFQDWTKDWDWKSTAVLSQNNTIESLVLAERYGIYVGFWFDILCMSRGLNLEGSLAFMAKHYGVGEKGDELKFTKGKRRKDFTQAEYARLALYGINDVDLTRAVFDKMLADGYPESELWLIHLTTLMFCEPRYLLDEQMLREYMIEEKERKAALLARCGLDKKGVGSNERLANAFREFGVEPPMKPSPSDKNKVTYAFAKNDVGMHALLEHEIEEVRWLAEARLAVKSTINESRGARFLELGKEGRRMPVQLNYYGAHTGRFAGAGKCNFQNLERTNKKDPKKGRLKKSLIAEPGWKIVAADSSQIEARGVALLAEHHDMVRAFASGEDIYSTFASKIYGRHVDRKRPEDEIPGFIAKVMVLGLGYGQGFSKLAENFLKGQSGPPIQFGMKEVEVMGVDLDKFIQDERKMRTVEGMISRLDLEARTIHCAVTDHLVRMYRTENKQIPAFWKQMKEILFAVANGIEGYFGPNDCLQTAQDKIILPNGMALHYPELRFRKRKEVIEEDGEDEDEAWRSSGFSYFDGLRRTRIYGGLLTENICQALARIVVTDQALHVYATTGYRPVSSTHDEWVYTAPDSEAEALKDYLVQTMKTAPKWARGWPLNAEGKVGQSYGG